MYLAGRGVARDDAQALAWLSKAADQGNALAQKALRMVRKMRDEAEGNRP